LSLVFYDEAERAASACKRLGILRFSFLGFFKSILNSIIMHPVSVLPGHLKFRCPGGELESSALYGREY